MRRDTFLKSLAALAATGSFPLAALAAANVKMMIPANPGGGWDTTGRALGKALQEAKVADSVTYDNKGGAAGALRYERDSGAVYFRDQVLELTPREAALLQALMARPGHAVSKERLFELVFPGESDVQYEAIEVVVYRLRKKLAHTGTSLMTLRGLGYLLKTT
jgi:DNA-binding response OmpR family regulator